MKTVCLALIAAAILVQCAVTPVFLRAQRPGRCKKSLITKMICATMFVLVGVFASLYGSNTSRFALLMLIGLGLSWFGDLFLHVLSEKKFWFVIGFFLFMSAHIVYIANYIRANRTLSQSGKAVGLVDALIVVGVMIVAAFVYQFAFRLNLKSVVAVPIAVYGLILTLMTEQAVKFCVLSASGGNLTGGLFAAVGAFLFFISDFTIAALIFGPEKMKQNYPLKCVNIWTYFIGQSLLGLTLLSVNI